MKMDDQAWSPESWDTTINWLYIREEAYKVFVSDMNVSDSDLHAQYTSTL